MYGIEFVDVFVGSIDRNEGAPYVHYVSGDNLIIHPQYDEVYVYNDIGLLRTTPMPLNGSKKSELIVSKLLIFI